MKDVKEVLKKYLVYFITILFLEFSFIIIMNNGLNLEKFINIILHSMILSSVLGIVGNIFKRKINNVINSIIFFIIGVLFSVQCVFYNTFKVYFSLSNLGLGDQLTSFAGEAVEAVIKSIIFVIIFMIPFILFLIFKKKLNLKMNNKNSYIAYLLILVITIPLFHFHVLSTKGKTNGTYELYYNVNEMSLNIDKLGVLNSYGLDYFRLIFGFKPKEMNYVSMDDEESTETDPETEKPIVYEPNVLDIDFTKETKNSSIKTINEYMLNENGTMKNKYTGMFEGYNLIYITAESFSEIGVSEELTPTLYKLTHTGFIFDNYYTPNALSTIGGEFQAVLGLYPDSAILPKWRSGSNYFPYGLGAVFKNLGYSTYAYHNNSYTFQDRYKYLASIGLDNFLACKNGMEKRMNCGKWPQSDDQMIEVTVPDYINNEEPFLAYYMTVSGHFGYTFKDNAMASKHKEEVKDLNLSEEAKAYVATQIELDQALERLLNELEAAGKLDNTVIVLLADHYPYKLDLKTVNELSTFERDEIVGVNHNNLIIWNSKLEDTHITKPCMSSDVLPTIYNLFGVDYDSRLFTGKDILSTAFGIAIMRNRSWITDKGIYYSKTGKFEGEEVDEEYIKNINTLVNNRLNISKLILETDYYKYLFKE